MTQRYQQEIDEILEKSDEEPTPTPVFQPSAHVRLMRSSRARGRTLLFYPSATRLLLFGLLLLFTALLLGRLAPSFAGVIAWLGVGLLVAAYIGFFTQTRRSSDEEPTADRHPDGDREESVERRIWRWITRG
jgi:hypothetical protein